MTTQEHSCFLLCNRERRMGHQRWCPTCQCHFFGDLIEHRRTKRHKVISTLTKIPPNLITTEISTCTMAKVSSRPFCTLCECHFRTPRKFVKHMKSPEHKQRAEELRNEGGPGVMADLITVDAIGCFEGEDDYEEDRNEEEIAVFEKHPAHRDMALEEMIDYEEYDPDTHYGTSFVIPVAGFLCKLCHKFYHFESSAKETHCRSLMHFQNLQGQDKSHTTKKAIGLTQVLHRESASSEKEKTSCDPVHYSEEQENMSSARTRSLCHASQLNSEENTVD
ncbi:hypothetical protein cypCar_00006282 [Cyprinus carpio]|nr:hypothetical protein cypCar_00006282 [Cyprinus carpio]